MDPDNIEGLNEIRPSVYRTAMKLQSLCNLEGVLVRHISAALLTVGGANQLTVGGANQQQDVVMSREEVMLFLTRMFLSVSQEVPGHVTAVVPEETCSLMFRMFDRAQGGCVSSRSLRAALICLSSDSLMVKYRALVSVAASWSASVSRSSLRCLLQDVSQVPAAVQEEAVFGSVEAALRMCFNGVLTPSASEEHVLSWLQSEPRLLLWLPTLYRLSVSKNVSHSVRCHTCKTLPISGLRYRCMKCVNVQVCQTCFLTNTHTRRHKTHHPMLEFCTQPTWRESLSSLVHSARHALLPRRHTQRGANSRELVCVETQNRAPPPSNASIQLADSDVRHSPSVSHDASVPPLRSSSSKALQTEGVTPPEASALVSDIRNLQRDKWLLEQQLQAWQLTVQSEHGILEDRGTSWSYDSSCVEEEPAGVSCLIHPIGRQDEATEEEQHEEDTCLSEAEDCGTCSPEELLQETADRLKTMMEAHRQTGAPHLSVFNVPPPGERKGAELLVAAEQVGRWMEQLVDAVRHQTAD
ncbi:dystrotelin [Scomber scombrus]|uniref:Dystrotelin n=1 Tax=Scomber scombrus TaxID=13677 RepID=A0AAV1QAW3_SCOSC